MKTTPPLPFYAVGAMVAKAVTVMIVLVAGIAASRAANDPVSAKLVPFSLADARAAIEAYCNQAPTNNALRPYVSQQFGRGFWFTNSMKELGVTIVDCGTTSPGYKITAIEVSPQSTRLEVRSMDAIEYRREYRPKRNARVIEELVRLLEKKP
jgi:hypothetical protein